MLYAASSVSINSEMNRTSRDGSASSPSCQTLGPPPPSPDGYTTMKPCSSATRFHWLVFFWAAPHMPAPGRLMTSGVGIARSELFGTLSMESLLRPGGLNQPVGRFATGDVPPPA